MERLRSQTLHFVFYSFSQAQRWARLPMITSCTTIVLDHPQVREVLDDVAIAIDAPFLVRTANPIDTQFRSDVGCIVQSLCHILQATPHQHIERAWVILACLLYNPFRTFSRLTKATGGSSSVRPCFTN